ncbi:MAG: DnaJ domain-containing protein, partial [Phycicoccus sp.]
MAGQDWFEKDFYAALGIPVDADDATIKKAYRKLARTHHPDATGGDESRFKEIGEAYSVLSDPEQRQQYDAIRTMTRGGARFAPGGGGSNGGFEDLLGGLFGGAAGGRAGPGAQFRPGGGGLDLEDLLRGMGGTGGFGPSFERGFDPYSATPGPRRGGDLSATTRLRFRDVAGGTTATLRLPDGRTVT